MLELLDFVVAILALELRTALVLADHPGSARRGPSGPSAVLLRSPPTAGIAPTASAHHAVRGNPRRRPVLELHAERQATLREHFLDLGERLLAEVRRLEQLHFGLLDEIADVVDAFGLQAVGRTHGQLEVVDRAQQDRIDARG